MIMALSLNYHTFSYKSIFVGLLFSHFFYGAVYSKKNLIKLKEKKIALLLASLILLSGLYFSFYWIKYAPHFLVAHAALSDAYLLPFNSKNKDSEYLKIGRTIFYSICFALLFIPMSSIALSVFIGIGFLSLGYILYATSELKNLIYFELPLVLIVIYMLFKNAVFDIHFLGFYHILTWYVFSYWMLTVLEKNGKKTISFFLKIGFVSFLFVLLFVFLVDTSITQPSFKKIIGFWSILHIMSSIFLSKFNPRFLLQLFYSKN